MKKVEVTIDIDTKPGKVIQAFTNFDMLHDWWNVERALVEKFNGGLYILAWDITAKGFGFISTGTIKNYQPDSLIEIENFVYLNPERAILGPMTLTINAQEKNGKTELYICQAGYQEGDDWNWYYEAVKQAWPMVAQMLKSYLEGI